MDAYVPENGEVGASLQHIGSRRVPGDDGAPDPHPSVDGRQEHPVRDVPPLRPPNGAFVFHIVIVLDVRGLHSLLGQRPAAQPPVDRFDAVLRVDRERDGYFSVSAQQVGGLLYDFYGIASSPLTGKRRRSCLQVGSPGNTRYDRLNSRASDRTPPTRCSSSPRLRDGAVAIEVRVGVGPSPHYPLALSALTLRRGISKGTCVPTEGALPKDGEDLTGAA